MGDANLIQLHWLWTFCRFELLYIAFFQIQSKENSGFSAWIRAGDIVFFFVEVVNDILNFFDNLGKRMCCVKILALSCKLIRLERTITSEFKNLLHSQHSISFPLLWSDTLTACHSKCPSREHADLRSVRTHELRLRCHCELHAWRPQSSSQPRRNS